MCARGAGEETDCVLENDLQCELRTSRSSTTEERIADADVAGSAESQRTQSAAGRRAVDRAYPCAGWVSNKIRQVWIRVIRVVEHVEELGPKL